MAKTNRVIALLRCSTDDQDLDHQRRAVAAWVAAQDAPLDLEVIEERGVSGAAAKRPGLERALRECREGRAAALWVREISRLGRSLVQVVQILHELHALGIRVVVAREGIDYGSPAGRFQAQLFAALAEFEREMIRERTRSGLAAARARGVKLGRPGYDWPPALEEIRELQAAGKSLRQIEREGLVKVFSSRGDGKAVVPTASAMAKALRRARRVQSHA